MSARPPEKQPDQRHRSTPSDRGLGRPLFVRVFARHGAIEWLCSLIAPPLLLLIPFATFLSHHDYSLFQPETIHITAVFAAIGGVLGLACAIAGRFVLVVVVAALATVLMDVQNEWWSSWSPWLFATFGAWALLGVLLRAHWARLAASVCVVSLLISIATPAGEPRSYPTTAESESTHDDGPPIVVHIVLDAQIGSEGIPSEFDPTGAVASALNRFYLESGFQLFGRTYGRYFDSNESISNMLNFEAPAVLRKFIADGTSRGGSVAKNAYFELMTERGYRMHIYQTDYLNFCSPEGRVEIASCFEYELETIAAIASADLALDDKAWLIARMYMRRSFILRRLIKSYEGVRTLALDSEVSLPKLREVPGRVSALTVPPVMERLAEDLRTAERGSLYFAHLLLPHYPYPYRGNCQLRKDITTWMVAGGGTPKLGTRSQREVQRERKYSLYLEQVICTHRKLAEVFNAMRESGIYRDSIIIVHGDHGSRIGLRPMRVAVESTIEPRDYVDSFSSLLAIKAPRITPAYDRRFLPMDSVFARYIRRGSIPAGRDWVPDNRVFLTRRESKRMAVRPMPVFSNGELVDGEEHSR
jgi:hypothetical protein